MRLFVLIGGLIVLALVTALVAPWFVNWDEYRDRFEAEASRLLGQPVQVYGDASAKLLPFPSVTFSDVRVGQTGEPTITIEQFSMDAELAPFLRGEVLIFDMRLVSPVVRLDIDEDGMPQWDWPSQSPIDPAQISLENATFTDGTIVLRDAAKNRHWDFVSLNGSAAAQSLFGPWRVEADGLIRGLPFETRFSTGTLSRDGFATRINALLPSADIEVNIDGRLTPPVNQTDAWLTGNATIQPLGDDGARYQLTGAIEANGRSISVPELRGAFGDIDDPYVINGALEILDGDEPRFTLSAKGNQINLDIAEDDGEAINLHRRLEEVTSAISQLPFPPIPGQVKLDLPTIVFGNTTLRDVLVDATREQESWTIEAFEAKLPGRTILEADGAVSLDPEPVFNGEMVLASRQPSGLASWLTRQVDEAIRALPRAGFSAEISLSAGQQSFENVQLILGEAALNGSLYRQADGSKLPSINIDLRGNNADFETIEALGVTLFDNNGTFRLADHDVDVTLDLIDARIGGLPIGGVNTALRVRGQRTEIDRLSLTGLFGASLSATGTLVRSNDTEKPGNTLSVDASLIAAEGQPLLQGLSQFGYGGKLIGTIADAAKRNPTIYDGTTLNVVGSFVLPDDGSFEGSASISGETGRSAVSMTTTLNGESLAFEDWSGSIDATLNNTETALLLSQFGFDVLPIRFIGEGQLDVRLSGDFGASLEAEVSLETPDTAINGAGLLTRDLDSMQFDGSGQIVAGDIEPWLDVFGYILPATGLGTSFNAKADIAYSDGKTNLQNLRGDAAGNSFAGNLLIENEGSSSGVNGALRLDELNSEFLASFATGRYELIDPAQLFNAPLYQDLSADIDLKANRLSIGQSTLEGADARLIFGGGGLSLQNLTAQLDEGEIAATIDAQNDNGSVLVNGQLAAKNLPLSSMLQIGNDEVTGTADVSATFSGAGNSSAALINALAGSGAVSVRGLEISGFNADGLTPLLKAADAIGYEITDSQIVALAEQYLPEGLVSVPPLELPLAISSGQIKTSNVTFPIGLATYSADISYELKDRAISGTGRMSYPLNESEEVGVRPEYSFTLSQRESDGDLAVSRNYEFITAYVRQRALEREQARVEAVQARLLEKQRLRREVRMLKFQERQRIELEQERLRLEQEKLEQERLEQQRIEREQAEREEQARQQRLLQEQIEQEREAAEAARADAQAASIGNETRQSENTVDAEPNSAVIDDALSDDPLAPIPNAGRIFENLDLGLGN